MHNEKIVGALSPNSSL